MPRGPLPTGNARRRNAPTIQATALPAGGRDEPAPECPYDLGRAGAKWWEWAWATPQATAWDDGALYALARRALLEDHRAALDFADHLDVADLLGGADPEAKERVEWALSTLKRSATGEVALMKEMREIDNRFGLNPKAMADLRWIIDATSGEADAKPAAPASVTRLRAV